MASETYEEWGWWAGRDDMGFTVGPFPTKDDAVQEALHAGDYGEVETPEGWRRVVHFAECCKLYYECDECGTVPEACEACRESLYPEECARTFWGSRNYGAELHGYEDEPEGFGDGQ